MVRIRVPATTANMGPGFDTLGMALKFYNYFEATPAEVTTVTLLPASWVEVDDMSLDPAENLLAQSYGAYFKFRGQPEIPARLGIEAHIPLARGLGSSSTAIVGGLVLANSLSPEPVENEQLVAWATDLEGHPDNVVPALLGGTRCCLSGNRSIRLPWPEDWGIVLVIPPTPLSTHRARSVMPPHYTAGEVVETLRGMAAWMHAVIHADDTLFRYALQADRIHQPARSALIPELGILQSCLADDPSVLGSVISGAGSTCAVFLHGETKPLIATLKAVDSLSHCRILPISPDCDGAMQQS